MKASLRQGGWQVYPISMWKGPEESAQKQDEYSNNVGNISHKQIFPLVQRTVATTCSVQLICRALSWVSVTYLILVLLIPLPG